MRSFIAIELHEKVKSALAALQQELKEHRTDIKWVKPDNIHLTLKFLGNIKEEKAENIIKKMEKVCCCYNPFPLEIKDIGMFHCLKSPRVLWVGTRDSGVLQRLQKDIDSEMASIGFEPEKRKFTAHLTLGRFRSRFATDRFLRTIKLHEKDRFGEVNVRFLSLMKSDLHPEGARYTRITEISLKTN